MPIRSRRRYAKKRSSRTLRTSRILTRTSSKSQALQINALKRKVNRVYRACKPEIKTTVSEAETIAYTSESNSSVYRLYPLLVPSPGVGENERLGDAIRVLNAKLYLSAEYFNNSSTGYHDSESAGCQVRVLVGQFKSPQPNLSVPYLSELFAFSSSTGPNYTQLAISPLRDGVTDKFYILKDYRFTLTSARNQAMRKLTVKPANVRWFNGVNEQWNNCWVAIVVTGLHWDTDFKETCKITFSNKIVYTDP